MWSTNDVSALSTDQMVEVDRLMIDEYGISLIQMMENAGRNLAELTRRILGGSVDKRRIAVLCGAGNNGGGGLAAARHLHNWGAEISLVLVFDPSHLKEIPAQQWVILQNMGLDLSAHPDLRDAELIIDAMIGYGLSGDPRQPVARWIERANAAGNPILSLDAPSGLDTNSGSPGNPCIKASGTLTLALPKTGLLSPAAARVVGDLYLADISVPPDLYRRLDIEIPNLFEQDSIIKLN